MDESEDVVVEACARCGDLVDSRSRIVNGVGPLDADILFVGEAPGEQEDAQGEPFVGRSGDILDEVLADYGLARDAVRITNCVKCRPPDNRDPTKTELANCRGYLDREIAAVDPEIVVTLGKVPSEHLLDRSVAVTAEAGEIASVAIDGRHYRLLICVHPAASLYDPSQRETLEDALARAAELVGASAEGGQSQLEEF
jgi:DNA polymerase